MSIGTIEKILWEFGEDSAKVEAFLSDPDGYLAQHPLSEEEFSMLRRMDFVAMDAYGVSNLLTMMVWQTLNGGSELMLFDYLKRMNKGNLPNNFQIPWPGFIAIRGFVAVRNAWMRLLSLLGVKKILT